MDAAVRAGSVLPPMTALKANSVADPSSSACMRRDGLVLASSMLTSVSMVPFNWVGQDWPRTTDPKRHLGEGVFFTSRMFDTFRVDANGLHFGHDGEAPPVPLIDVQVASGTRIQRELSSWTAAVRSTA